jgi:transcriptional regulator with GAF, ATPase, and Fis domain
LSAREKQLDRIQQRYHKIRRICREANRKRRHLRDKVNLLCQDLVHSNMQFTETLHSLQRAYEFQSSLMGEFDGRYLLYKALRELKSGLPESNAAIYLCRKNQFEAHLTGPGCEELVDIPEIETLLTATVVRQTMNTGQSYVYNNIDNWQDISPHYREQLRGLTLMALPIEFEDELLGVLVFYRAKQKGFCCKDKALLERLMLPLAQAIASVQKLEHLLV